VTRIVTVDLASRFSAGMLMERGGQVPLSQFDSWGKSSFATADDIGRLGSDPEVDLILLEDLPHGLQGMMQIKPPSTFQGIVIRTLGDLGILDKVLWVNPATWQRPMGVFGKNTPSAIEVAKEQFDYEVPDLVAIHDADLEAAPKGPERNKIRAKLRKNMTDYADAFLMAKWVDSINLKAEPPYRTGVQVTII
jgi:hypothetical protein